MANPKLWSERRCGELRFSRSTVLNVSRPSTVAIAVVSSVRRGSGVAARRCVITASARANAAFRSGCTLRVAG